MRFSIVLALAVVTVFAIIFIRSTFGEHAAIVFGLCGLVGLHLFFKYVMNG
jgi:hypothetical protein